MELVDIVDGNNQVLYQVPKTEAHERGLLHRCIIAEVIDGAGKWTLVKQAADRQDARQYVSPVGEHISAGETEIVALKRETLEELGLTDFTYKYIGRAIYNRFVKNRQENHYFILYEIYTDQVPTLNHESIEFKKFSREGTKRILAQNPREFGAAFHFVLKEFYQELIRK